ncbi:MAG TPA: endonuclease MutS2 [Oscillospiraceae bacterium]|nr:endonuclease MutS2 [Oscillospiraceae bacterium]
MKNIQNKHYKALELDKVLNMLAPFTCNKDARKIAFNIVPENSLELAQSLLNQTKDAYGLLSAFSAPSFEGLKNVNEPLSRAKAGATLSMRELLDIASVLRVTRKLRQWRENNGCENLGIDVFFYSIALNKYLEDKIFTSILSEDEMSDRASSLLSSIRRKIKNCENKARSSLEKMIKSQHYKTYLQDAIITQRNGRYVVPVKAEHRGSVDGLIHDSSSSGQTVFVEPIGVVEANNEIRILKGQEQEEIERILSELSVESGGCYEDIKSGYECAIELNIIFAKAQLAYQMKASVPRLNDNGIINLKKARHPLISPSKVVATDIRLGKQFDTLIITGPNTGGKTVSIKTIGLLTLMAMCGMFIPAADESDVSIFKNVLADIGDEQSIEQSLSTFSSHMVNLIEIINISDNKSLVLIDELGSGTDPIEGAALAISLLETLSARGAKVAATTHYAELKAYALETNRVENASCEFDVNTLRPTFRLMIGLPGRSNAFAISERLGLNKSVIERAKKLVSSDNLRFETVVEELEKNRIELEKKQDIAKKMKDEAYEDREKAKSIFEDAKAVRNKEIDKAKGEALRIVENAKREALMLLFEVDKLKKEAANTKDTAELARRAKSAVSRHLDAIDKAVNPIAYEIDDNDDYTLPRELVIGDEVYCKTIGKNATVSSKRDRKGVYEITAGVLKMRVSEKSLRLLEKAPEKKAQQTVYKPINSDGRAGGEVATSCDLRGLMVEEAIMALDQFIDNTILSGINEFTIIHGKGTGALRAAVGRHLKGHSLIESFRLGRFGEGESGVTIAKLK